MTVAREIAARAPSLLQPARPLHHIALSPPFDALMAPLPPDVDTVPSMMSLPERTLLYNLLLEHWTGRGIVLDAGLMCGASTVLFGRALQQRGTASRRPLVAIELGVAGPGEARFIRKHAPDFDIAEGGSFAPLVERFVAPVRDVVDLRFGDIAKVGAVKKPIEILFLDVMKAKATADFCTRTYVPQVWPGAFVVQQDYFVDTLPWIREQQEHLFLTGTMRYLGEVGPTALFQYKRRPAQSDCDEAVSALPYDHVVRLLSAAEQRPTDPFRRLLCGLSRVWRAAELRGPEEAASVLHGVRQTYAAQIAERSVPRIVRGLDAAEYLCRHPWTPDAQRIADLMVAGHDPLGSVAERSGTDG